MMRGTVGRTSHGAVGMKVHGAGAENWVTRHNIWIIAWRGGGKVDHRMAREGAGGKAR